MITNLNDFKKSLNESNRPWQELLDQWVKKSEEGKALQAIVGIDESDIEKFAKDFEDKHKTGADINDIIEFTKGMLAWVEPPIKPEEKNPEYYNPFGKYNWKATNPEEHALWKRMTLQPHPEYLKDAPSSLNEIRKNYFGVNTTGILTWMDLITIYKLDIKEESRSYQQCYTNAKKSIVVFYDHMSRNITMVWFKNKGEYLDLTLTARRIIEKMPTDNGQYLSILLKQKYGIDHLNVNDYVTNLEHNAH